MEENLFFTIDKINAVINDEKEHKERIEKGYSSIKSFNQFKEGEEKIIKYGGKYKLISDGIVVERFNTKKEVENFLKKETAGMIKLTNYFLCKMTDDYFFARMSLLNYNLQKAGDEVNQEFSRLAEINNRVNKKEEVICVGNYIYFNMGEEYVAMNIHDFSETTVKEIDYDDFIINQDIQNI